MADPEHRPIRYSDPHNIIETFINTYPAVGVAGNGLVTIVSAVERITPSDDPTGGPNRNLVVVSRLVMPIEVAEHLGHMLTQITTQLREKTPEKRNQH